MIPPDTLPVEAIDSINSSKNGKGDFPVRYVVETSLMWVFSWGALRYLPKLLVTCITEEYWLWTDSISIKKQKPLLFSEKQYVEASIQCK